MSEATPGSEEDMIARESDKTWYPDQAETLEAAVGQAVGAGSVCWESMAGTGVFQDGRANAVVDGLLKWISDHNVVSPKGGYTTEVGGVVFSQVQWETAQAWSRGDGPGAEFFDKPRES